jgi:hypothetical protein
MNSLLSESRKTWLSSARTCGTKFLNCDRRVTALGVCVPVNQLLQDSSARFCGTTLMLKHFLEHICAVLRLVTNRG